MTSGLPSLVAAALVAVASLAWAGGRARFDARGLALPGAIGLAAWVGLMHAHGPLFGAPLIP